jgi:alkylation response protein AidB-like acyl-CoA dehydrogenase
MDFNFTPEQEAFRQEIRQWLKQELPPDWDDRPVLDDYDAEHFEFTKQIVKKLGAKGWLTLHWPKEYGGMGMSPVEQLIYKEEMTYNRVPGIDMGTGGVTWVGPTLMALGTEEQKKAHLPKIAAGEQFWCTGYSEPESGSDMAAAKCRAVADGDEYVINGQKLWTSHAHIADWCWLMVRTGPQEPKHKGLSTMLVDMKTPGVTVRPLINMAGIHYFNEVFFDDVRVPRSNLVGEENRGWYNAVFALDFERTAGVVQVTNNRRILEDLLRFAKETRIDGQPIVNDAMIRGKLAQLAVDAEVGRMLAYRIVWMQSRGLIPNYESSMLKVFSYELLHRVLRVGTQAMRLYGQLEIGSKWAPLNGRIENALLSSVGSITAAGTHEIQRNIIATRGLGLPR